MSMEVVIERFFEALIDGDRPRARGVIAEQIGEGRPAREIVTDLLWPTYELVDRLHRADQLSDLSFNFATRLLRQLVDQTAGRLRGSTTESAGRRVLAACGPSEADELGAQIAVDLMEADGLQVRFAGGGIASDEIMAQVQESRPDVLVLFCSAPCDLPGIRGLIDTLREIGACPNTQVVVGGGVFNRADGLAEEIGADLWAEHPLELVDIVTNEPEHRAETVTRAVSSKPRRRAA